MHLIYLNSNRAIEKNINVKYSRFGFQILYYFISYDIEKLTLEALMKNHLKEQVSFKT